MLGHNMGPVGHDHNRPAARNALGVAGGLLLLTAAALADTQAPGNGAWQLMRSQLYGTRDIGEGSDALMSIEAPGSTPDPSATPVVIRFGGDLVGKVRQVRLVIDNNPSPLAATMNLTAALPIDEIDLRVRIDRFTSVRAIAETDGGRLEMRSTWVNASGGCSAPPAAADGGALGQVRFRTSEDNRALQFSIRHPNNSGFQVDPRTGDLIPPHFVARIRLLQGGKTVFDADTGISLSENPTLRIATHEPLTAPLSLEASDLPTQSQFHATWQGTATAAN
jgi:sulfur-oxidizing protein SoxY